MHNIRILLADDHPLIRAGFKSMLGKTDRFEIVGEAENGKQLLERAQELQPDIILVDISMPVLSGLDAIAQLSALGLPIKFIVLSMHEEREYILHALRIGASGYLLKNIERFELERAITTVFEGGKCFSPRVTNILAESFANPETPELDDLTPREKEVLGLVAKGNSTKQVAHLLGISIRTVESHRINMLKKMKVGNTAELVKKALAMKIIS